MIYVFELKEKAIGKERPRFNTQTGKAYTPEKTQSFEELIKWTFISKYKLKEKPSLRPFKVEIRVVYKPSKSVTKQMLLYTKDKPCVVRPDVDNIAKIILDALNKIVYQDDSQVCDLHITKKYGEEDRITIVLEELGLVD